MITIIPAIDLKDGRCVRLQQGRADDAKVYSEDPVGMAQHWEAEGAQYLHVVDLDGAFLGHPVHLEIVGKIAGAISIPVEVGGGLRTNEDVNCLLDCGVARAIIGTRALAGVDTLTALANEFAEKIAVGIDAREGLVQVKGWVETTETEAIDLAAKADEAGIKTLIVTDTARDGMMSGSNVEPVDKICKRVGCRVIASGGITSVEDISALKELGHSNLKGAIVGKALYEGKVTLSELQIASS